MQVVVIGANGNVGGYVVKKLAEKNYECLAIVAKENQIEELKKMGATNAAVYDEQTILSRLQSYRRRHLLNRRQSEKAHRQNGPGRPSRQALAEGVLCLQKRMA